MATALETVTRYDRAAVREAILAGCAPLGGLTRIVAGRRRVLVKPNFLLPEPPAAASTTHPAVYMTLATLLAEMGCEVTIADSPAFGPASLVARRHGVLRECRRLGVRVMTLRRAREVAGVADCPVFGRLTVARELERFDAVVNVPKLKVHQQTVITGATKNLFGCVTGKRKAYRHLACRNDLAMFSRMILRNAEVVAPVLTVADGVVALHRRGPRGGAPYPLERLVVSDSWLETDWLFCRMIGLEPVEVPLFQALEASVRERVEASLADVLRSPQFRVAEGFEPAPRSPIAFTLGRLVRSAVRSVLRRG